MQYISRKSSQHAFTVVELLIVIVVIAILAAISLVSFNNVQAKARDSERKSDIAAIQKVVEAYYVDHGKYPSRLDMQDPAWRSENLIVTDQGIFINPQDTGSTNSIVASGSTVALHKYSYYEMPTGAGTGGYHMSYKLEANPTSNISIAVTK